MESINNSIYVFPFSYFSLPFKSSHWTPMSRCHGNFVTCETLAPQNKESLDWALEPGRASWDLSKPLLSPNKGFAEETLSGLCGIKRSSVLLEIGSSGTGMDMTSE